MSGHALVSVDIDSVYANATESGEALSKHVFQCRSDVTKLRVIQTRLQGMCQDLQSLQRFLSCSVSNSDNAHHYLQGSLQSAYFMLEGVLGTIQREQQVCLRNLQEKLPGSQCPIPQKTRFQVDGGWNPGSLVVLNCAGIQYQVKAPSNTKPGDWLEFDSNTCILTKFDR